MKQLTNPFLFASIIFFFLHFSFKKSQLVGDGKVLVNSAVVFIHTLISTWKMACLFVDIFFNIMHFICYITF